MKTGKKYREALKLVDQSKIYTIDEAAPLLKKTSVTKFDSTIDVSFRLNVNPTLADQLIRGTLVLPHGSGLFHQGLHGADGALSSQARAA